MRNNVPYLDPCCQVKKEGGLINSKKLAVQKSYRSMNPGYSFLKSHSPLARQSRAKGMTKNELLMTFRNPSELNRAGCYDLMGIGAQFGTTKLLPQALYDKVRGPSSIRSRGTF